MAPDYKCIFVGDAAMSPYEILHPGGANEHWNREAGQVWLDRACAQWPNHLWINPVAEKDWDYTRSTGRDPRDFRRPDGADDAGRYFARDQGVAVMFPMALAQAARS